MPTDDPLSAARAALASGDGARAVDLAWKAVRPAVLAQDSPTLEAAVSLAERVAQESDGEVRRGAEQLATYCSACLMEPHDVFPFSMKGLFGRRRSKVKRCPDCAEEIQLDARVCRFCGYRYREPGV